VTLAEDLGTGPTKLVIHFRPDDEEDEDGSVIVPVIADP